MTSFRWMLVPVLLGAAAIAGAGCGGSTSSSSGSGGAAGGSGGTAGATGGSGAKGGTDGGGTGATGGTAGGGTGGAGGTAGSGTGGAGGAGGTAGGGTGGAGGTAGSGTGGAGGAGSSCVTNKDCPNNGLCGYPEKDGCAANGSCFPAPGAVCSAFSPGCACNGNTINMICTGLPGGYLSAPLLHAGQCSDAGSGFPCGSSLSCDSATQYCKVAEGGPCCNPPAYSCQAIPATCAQNHTCACIEPAVGAQQCTESGGGVTATFQYP